MAVLLLTTTQRLYVAETVAEIKAAATDGPGNAAAAGLNLNLLNPISPTDPPTPVWIASNSIVTMRD